MMELTSNETEKVEDKISLEQGQFGEQRVTTASEPSSWRCWVCGWILESGIQELSELQTQFGEH